MNNIDPVLIGGLVLAGFELFVRLKPTEKNISILDFLHKVVNLMLPNIKKENDYVQKDKFKIK